MSKIGSNTVPVFIDELGRAKPCAVDPADGVGNGLITAEWLKNHGGAGGSIRVPVLTPMWFDHVVLNDSAWIQSDGLWKDKSDAQLIYDHLVEDWNNSNSVEETETISDITITFKRAADGHKIVTVANDNLDTLFEATGVAWYYVLDTVNEKFKLPRSNFKIFALGSTAPDKSGLVAKLSDLPQSGNFYLYFSTGVGESGSDVINVGGGTCVPNYDVYDPDKHNVGVLLF